ncbi:unnamed protein product [Acanthoscelides obtectus]|uniref:Uncharacterized protein n=1 Tax=Acanthoscelides obtectus TaxID=200917 RepID=A0A9P0LTF9_ACAOB|nr:unnamed protein product [Acanthoscelides obtectus]CAK1664137.1 hypothetical protein AOBTE_LOCUS24075 [Acanthoscelides obtectus]
MYILNGHFPRKLTIFNKNFPKLSDKYIVARNNPFPYFIDHNSSKFVFDRPGICKTILSLVVRPLRSGILVLQR